MFDTKLPQPNHPFDWVQADGQVALVCRALEPFARHLMTTRGWQLGIMPAADGRAWQQVAAAAGGQLVRVHQVHGGDVFVRRATGAAGHEAEEPPAADVIASDDPSATVAIQTADCVPILIADRRTGVVAAAHAGWRGLAIGVPRITIEALGREFGSRPADLIAAVGPSIRACCYEVGGDVRDRFEEGGWQAAIDRWFFSAPQPTNQNASMAGSGSPPRAARWYFDSAAAARDQLASAGLPGDQIFVAGLCTASHPSVFCSYRRDGSHAGRMAALITAAPPRRP